MLRIYECRFQFNFNVFMNECLYKKQLNCVKYKLYVYEIMNIICDYRFLVFYVVLQLFVYRY